MSESVVQRPTHTSGILLVTGLVVLAVAAGFGVRYAAVQFAAQRNAQAAAKAAAEAAAAAAPSRAVPDFAFTNQEGKIISRQDLAGRVWIADFMFTHCTTGCPRMANRMKQLQEGLTGVPGIALISFSIDPKRDTPDRLKVYAETLGASSRRWQFLTGDQRAIHKLANEAFQLAVAESTAQERAQGADPFTHSSRFALVDAQGQVRETYDSNDDAAIQKLLADAIALAGGKQP
jgi:cytochrome oxidase Cu insertion factor (SCO1/SenC/PrrC family)